MMRIAILMGLLAAAPLAAQDVSLPHTLFTLPNGLTVIVHEDDSAPIAAVNVWYHVGSGYEEPGRTGFAHLFEHIMFEGSGNVPEGEFDRLLEGAGGVNNGSTSPDRTNYYEMVPANAVELALWLEADRMGNLLETMTQQKLDIQREVVKNERRQSYENRPYGMYFETVFAALYPQGHPYSWSTIGSMEDLSAASLDDVESFFRRYYSPNNAALVVAGDVDTEEIRRIAARFFGWIPRGDEVRKPDLPVPAIPETRYITLEDRVTLPQLNLAWRAEPFYAENDAALDALAQILSTGKNSRLFRRLIYDEQIAQDVLAFNNSQLLSGDFFIRITGREDLDLNRLETAVLEEIRRIAETPPAPAELERVINGIETNFVSSLERALGKADQLNQYYYYTGEPDFAAEDLARYRSLTPADVQAAARDYLLNESRIVISIVPQGRTELAAEGVGR
ncbi:MAG: pitrilysin family protein [Gemmatimonadota bacterium]